MFSGETFQQHTPDATISKTQSRKSRYFVVLPHGGFLRIVFMGGNLTVERRLLMPSGIIRITITTGGFN